MRENEMEQKEDNNCKQAQSEIKTLNHNPIHNFTKYSKGMNIGVYEIPHDFI